MPNCTYIRSTESALADLCIVSRVRTPSFPPRNPVQVKKPHWPTLSLLPSLLVPLVFRLRLPTLSFPFAITVAVAVTVTTSIWCLDITRNCAARLIQLRRLGQPNSPGYRSAEVSGLPRTLLNQTPRVPPRGPASKGPNNTCRPEATTTLCSALLCSGVHFLRLHPSTPSGTRQTFGNLFALLNSPRNIPRDPPSCRRFIATTYRYNDSAPFHLFSAFCDSPDRRCLSCRLTTSFQRRGIASCSAVLILVSRSSAIRRHVTGRQESLRCLPSSQGEV